MSGVKDHQIHPVQRAANTRNMRRRANIMWDFGEVWYPTEKHIGVRLKNGHTFALNIETLATKIDKEPARRQSDCFAVMDELERASKLPKI